jgi:hypothetical protein
MFDKVSDPAWNVPASEKNHGRFGRLPARRFSGRDIDTLSLRGSRFRPRQSE